MTPFEISAILGENTVKINRRHRASNGVGKRVFNAEQLRRHTARKGGFTKLRDTFIRGQLELSDDRETFEPSDRPNHSTNDDSDVTPSDPGELISEHEAPQAVLPRSRRERRIPTHPKNFVM